jgi:curved DNA-binding protein
MGAEWKAGQEFHPPPNWDQGFEFRGGDFGSIDHSEFFEALFGRRASSAGARHSRAGAQGEDHHAQIEIELKDAYRGGQRSLSLRAPMVDAQGHVVLRERRVEVSIPKGVRAGQHLRLSGQGTPGIGGAPAGDLYLEIVFRPDARFRVEGRDVFTPLALSPWEAALGATVSVTTPDGTVALKVPAGAAAGRKLRLKGKGIPGREPGDLFAEIELVIPPADSPSAVAAYRAFAKAFAVEAGAKAGASL